MSHTNTVGPGVELDPSSQVSHSWLSHVKVGAGCRIIGCVLQGHPEHPIVIEEGAVLLQSQLDNSEAHKQFRFGAWQATSTPTHIGRQASIQQSQLLNTSIGAHTQVLRSSVEHSQIGANCQLRAHSKVTLSQIADACNLGSEVSKSILAGEGFVSEHTASYLSLVAPGTYPILTAEGKEQLIEGLPNLTNIGAGTVFANYSGKPKPADALSASNGSQKGTGLSYGAFTAVNSIIVNRYGQPGPDEDPFSLLRRDDLTILGFNAFVEKKVTGRVPAFSYATQTSARHTKIGWVLDAQPGIVLNIYKKMREKLGTNAHKLHQLIEGTIRLEIQLLEELCAGSSCAPFDEAQCKEGLKTLHGHLDGRWHIDEEGKLTAPWRYCQEQGRWRPQ